MVGTQADWDRSIREMAEAWQLQEKLEAERRDLQGSRIRLSAPEAIRRKCLECKAYRAEHVRQCDALGCWLHPWRTGDASRWREQEHRRFCEPRCCEENCIRTGRYVAVICESHMVPTRTGGQYLDILFRICEGEYAGRTLRRKLFLAHGPASQRNEARVELETICRSVGVLTPRDSSELHGIPLTLCVEQKPEQDGRRQSVIEGYGRHEKKNINPTVKEAATK